MVTGRDSNQTPRVSCQMLYHLIYLTIAILLPYMIFNFNMKGENAMYQVMFNWQWLLRSAGIVPNVSSPTLSLHGLLSTEILVSFCSLTKSGIFQHQVIKITILMTFQHRVYCSFVFCNLRKKSFAYQLTYII
jgi:hypothetical protein